ncbi:MAG: hypothetical protein ABII74_10485 [Elusimicrobiota bacterium]
MITKKIISFIVLFHYIYGVLGTANGIFSFPNFEAKGYLRAPSGFSEGWGEKAGIKESAINKISKLSDYLKMIYGEEIGMDNIEFVEDEGKHWFVRVDLYKNLLQVNTASSQIPFAEIPELLRKIFFHEFAEKFIHGELGFGISPGSSLTLAKLNNKIANRYFFIPAFSSKLEKYLVFQDLDIFASEDLFSGVGDILAEKIALGLFLKHKYGLKDEFMRENVLYQSLLAGRYKGKKFSDGLKNKLLVDLAVKIAVLKQQEKMVTDLPLKGAVNQTIADLENLAEEIFRPENIEIKPLKKKILELLNFMKEHKVEMKSFDYLVGQQVSEKNLKNEFLRLVGIIKKKKFELSPETVYFAKRIIFEQLVEDFRTLYADTVLAPGVKNDLMTGDVLKNLQKKVEEDLVDSRKCLRSGDVIEIKNERNDGSTKALITLALTENPKLEMKWNVGTAKEDNESKDVVFKSGIDPRNGIDLKKDAFIRKEMPDYSVIEQSVYNFIKEKAGIDLDNLSGNLKEKGIQPLMFEGGGFILIERKSGKVKVIPSRKKYVFCKEGVVYSLGVGQSIPTVDEYEILAIYHNHPGLSAFTSVLSTPDLMNMLISQIPYLLFTDSETGGFNVIQYRLKEEADLTAMRGEVSITDKDYLSRGDAQRYLGRCRLIVDKYLDTRKIFSWENLFWTVKPEIKINRRKENLYSALPVRVESIDDFINKIIYGVYGITFKAKSNFYFLHQRKIAPVRLRDGKGTGYFEKSI